MASIKYYPNLRKGDSKIYIRLSLKRGKDFRLSTGLTIKNVDTWDFGKNFPKKNSDTNKVLHRTLKELESYIEDQLYKIEVSRIKSIDDLSSSWLKGIILEYFNETPTSNIDFLILYAKSYADNLKNRTFQRNGRRKKYTENTISKYNNFANQLADFERSIGVSLRIKDVDEDFANKFLTYLTDIKRLSINTKGRYVKRLKSIVKDAEVNGIKVNPKYNLIKGFEDQTVVTYLTFDEIDSIIDFQVTNETLQIAKEWLIIGCYTGQRISDLFRMRKEMIVDYAGTKYISFSQFKTEKKVMVPIHFHVQDILDKYEGNFPHNLYENEKSNRTQLSGLMKEVCKKAEINEIVKGRYNGVIGSYPKYKLIQNHTCRRSFASNFYGKEGWTTPMIMEITGHMTEKNFLKYIDKDNFYLSEQAAKNFAKMKKENKKYSNQKALRVISNS